MPWPNGAASSFWEQGYALKPPKHLYQKIRRWRRTSHAKHAELAGG